MFHLQRCRWFLWPILFVRRLDGVRRLSGIVALAMAVGGWSGRLDAAELPAADGKWSYYASPNFELYSRNDERSSRELLHNLELLRAVFLERLNLKERRRVEVTVYYFRTKAEFQAYAPEAMRANDSFAGFHLFRPDRAVISMAPTEESEVARQIVFHEYVHHLFQIAEYDPPLWFNEGTAEVLAGMKVERKRVLIGSPLENLALYLRQESLLPLGQLFAADQSSKAYADEKHTGVFYAQSWALLHYWHFGDSKIPKDAVDRFLRVAGDREKAAAVDLEQHFVSCFGFDYREMHRRLANYVRSGRFRAGAHPLPAIAAGSTYARRAVPVDEIAVRLAELALRVNRSALAKLRLLEAIDRTPNDPRLWEVLGMDAYLDQDEQGAIERWEGALAAGSKNPAIIRELALMEGRRWFERFDESFQLPDATAARMRGRLLRSIEAEPHQAAAYEMLAWVEAFASAPTAENVNRVIGQLPSMREKKRTLLPLTWLMLRVGNGASAASMLGVLGTLRLSGDEAQAFSILQTRLLANHPEFAAAPVGGSSDVETTIAPPPSSPGLKTPSLALPDDL